MFYIKLLLLSLSILGSPFGQVTLDPSSHYCRLRGSHLQCDFTRISEPVFVLEDLLENIDSVSCIGPPVLHLPENFCMKSMDIRHAGKVVVYGRTWNRQCHEYNLSVSNSTLTAIPRLATNLQVVCSTVSNFALQPTMERVSVVASELALLSTDRALNGSAVVNIANTTIYYLYNLSASNNAKVQFSTSYIAYMDLQKTIFQDHASLVMIDSKIRTGAHDELVVPVGVSVKLDRLDNNFAIRAINGAQEVLTSPVSEPISILKSEGSSPDYLFIIHFLAATLMIVVLLIFAKFFLKKQCGRYKGWMEIVPKTFKVRQTGQDYGSKDDGENPKEKENLSNIESSKLVPSPISGEFLAVKGSPGRN